MVKGMTDTFRPIKSNKRTFELVAEQIREAILSGQFKPGSKLPSERDLAVKMNVGRPVIRESLRALEMSGLIRVKPGAEGGIFIKRPDASGMIKIFSDLVRLDYIGIDELTEARLMIEQDILELAVQKINPEDYRALDELLAQATEKINRGEKIRRENFQFHTELTRLAGNAFLVIVINSLVAVISVFVENLDPPLAHSRKILESHKRILQDLKRGDLSKAKKRVADHILYFGKEFHKVRPLKRVKFDEAIMGEWRYL
jgi:DNA-binding FadR family transcriptional regulator